MMTKTIRRLGIAGALLAAFMIPSAGTIAFAQDGSPATTTANTTQQDDGNDFPWGLLGLLGLGGLAGLRRREQPVAIDASRAANRSH